jgi:NAD(P)-dependent dehydrogenase (short-subunit alcohol dehydrogenase family)
VPELPCPVVIVTGAGTGIGVGTVRRFLREGAIVTLNGRRELKLRETIAGFDAAKSLVHPGDVSDEEYVKRLVEDTVSQFWETGRVGQQRRDGDLRSFRENYHARLAKADGD